MYINYAHNRYQHHIRSRICVYYWIYGRLLKGEHGQPSKILGYKTLPQKWQVLSKGTVFFCLQYP